MDRSGHAGTSAGRPAEGAGVGGRAASSASPAAVSVRCWGTRGSIPSPGPDTAAYGGNTSCLEVRASGRRVIFDAGTGIRPLGGSLVQDGGEVDVTVFLTHFHWDHIQGFPFFSPLYDPGSRLRIFGPRQGEQDVETLFAGQMGPIYFPVPHAAIAGQLEFGHLNEGTWEEEGVRVRTIRLRHPSYTVGYRLDAGGASVCYLPDNELSGGSYEVDGEEWRKDVRDFVRGADVLVHDAMFTDEEYVHREGWGHSTYGQALALAEEAEVGRLLFFHHAPDRGDAELDTIVAGARAEAEARGSTVVVDAATEGPEILL